MFARQADQEDEHLDDVEDILIDQGDTDFFPGSDSESDPAISNEGLESLLPGGTLPVSVDSPTEAQSTASQVSRHVKVNRVPMVDPVAPPMPWIRVEGYCLLVALPMPQ